MCTVGAEFLRSTAREKGETDESRMRLISRETADNKFSDKRRQRIERKYGMSL